MKYPLLRRMMDKSSEAKLCAEFEKWNREKTPQQKLAEEFLLRDQAIMGQGFDGGLPVHPGYGRIDASQSLSHHRF